MRKYLVYIYLLSIYATLGAAIPPSQSSKKIVESYVSLYAPIAVMEMKRVGIPASIKLAQGLLESDLGRSPMAVQANNHFGIKCGGNWEGETFYKLDDDTDTLGNIIQSCFRAYATPQESFVAHSDFLTDPSKRSRYGFLFQLSTTDYVGWANGLKFAGYATDPSYPSKIINLIENYQLYLYDEAADTVAENASSEGEMRDEVVIQSTQKANQGSSKNGIYTYPRMSKNGLKMVLSHGGESVAELAKKVGISIHELMEYNEELIFPDMNLKPNEIVYLEKKHKLYTNKENAYHTVKSGESVYYISQLYGVRLETLRARNHIPYDAEPLVGEKLYLSKTIASDLAPRYAFVEKFDQFVDLGELK